MKNVKPIRFDFQKICANLLKGLPERTVSVVERRFGLKGEGKETLESIGESYDITRERVRQIEREGLSKIKISVKEYPKLFAYFSDLIESLGGIKKERSFVSLIGKGKNQNQILFLLTLAGGLQKYPEDENYYSFWAKDENTINSAKRVVDLSVKRCEEIGKPIDEEKFLGEEKQNLSKIIGKKLDSELVSSYLEISKIIKKNPESQIGLANWVEINPKSIKDIAYLVLKKEGKSLHFSKVAELIQNSPYFLKDKTHVATVHNELIKDYRFVLVGRGLYALKEWGYEPGVVREVIKKVLVEENKPLSKEEILERVLKQRFVKTNTVFLNLQNKNYFLRDSEGNYTINTA